MIKSLLVMPLIVFESTGICRMFSPVLGLFKAVKGSSEEVTKEF
jgi:hypothetical protein